MSDNLDFFESVAKDDLELKIVQLLKKNVDLDDTVNQLISYIESREENA